MHISDGSIPASRVAGCSCTIPASPTTTGSCTLFIARKLMRIRPGLATLGRRAGLPLPWPARSTARPAAATAPSTPPSQHFSCSCSRTKKQYWHNIHLYATNVLHAKYAFHAYICTICTIYIILKLNYLQYMDYMQYTICMP